MSELDYAVQRNLLLKKIQDKYDFLILWGTLLDEDYFDIEFRLESAIRFRFGICFEDQLYSLYLSNTESEFPDVYAHEAIITEEDLMVHLSFQVRACLAEVKPLLSGTERVLGETIGSIPTHYVTAEGFKEL